METGDGQGRKARYHKDAMKITLKKEEVTKIPKRCNSCLPAQPIQSVQLRNEDNFNCRCYSRLGCCIAIPKKKTLIILLLCGFVIVR